MSPFQKKFDATHTDHCHPHYFRIERADLGSDGPVDSASKRCATKVASSVRLCMGHLHGGCSSVWLVHPGLPASQYCRLYTHPHSHTCHLLQLLEVVQLSRKRKLPWASVDHAMDLWACLCRDRAVHTFTAALPWAITLWELTLLDFVT